MISNQKIFLFIGINRALSIELNQMQETTYAQNYV
jgi:hypothetical protein